MTAEAQNLKDTDTLTAEAKASIKIQSMKVHEASRY